MPLETAIWRRFPIRGPGRLVIPRAQRRAQRRTLIARGPFGIRIAVDPDNAAELSIYLWGTCAPEVETALARLITAGDPCLDLGAGTGVFSAMIGALNRPGRVLAVEPSPDAAARIPRQAALNGLTVEVVNAAMTDIDAAVAPALLGEPVQLAWIRADGGEPAVLRGAHGLIESSRPALIFDWCQDSWTARGEDPVATADLLEGLRYVVFAPVMRPAPAWSVRPPACDRFEPAPLAELATGRRAGYVVALPETATRAASQLTRPR